MRLAGRLAVGGVCLAMAVVACSGATIPDEVHFSGVNGELWRGPDHCDWDGTHFVLIDEDLPGAEVTNVDMPGSHMFVRDPDEVREYQFEAPSDPSRPVPSEAAMVAKSDDGSIELWYSSDDPQYLYVVGEDLVEAWVRATFWGLCA